MTPMSSFETAVARAAWSAELNNQFREIAKANEHLQRRVRKALAAGGAYVSFDLVPVPEAE